MRDRGAVLLRDGVLLPMGTDRRAHPFVGDPGRPKAPPCGRPAVARASYGLWCAPDARVPEGATDPSTLFIGVCQEHLEVVRKLAERRGGALETVDPS